MKTHSGEKSYKCNQCEYASVQAVDLRRHLKSHSGEKLFKCGLCDFASVWAVALRTHLKTHSGEKSYKCNQCDYASARADDLRRHLKIHSGEKSYKCNQCNYASVRANILRSHLKTHLGEKSQLCNQCNYASVKVSNWKTRMRLSYCLQSYLWIMFLLEYSSIILDPKNLLQNWEFFKANVFLPSVQLKTKTFKRKFKLFLPTFLILSETFRLVQQSKKVHDHASKAEPKIYVIYFQVTARILRPTRLQTSTPSDKNHIYRLFCPTFRENCSISITAVELLCADNLTRQMLKIGITENGCWQYCAVKDM